MVDVGVVLAQLVGNFENARPALALRVKTASGDRTMKSIRNAMRFLVMAAMAGVLFTPRAEATSISVSPHFQNVNVGDPVTVDILVSDYSPSVVGGASFSSRYDSTLLTSTSFLLDPDLKMSNALNPILDFGSGFIGAGGTSPFEAFFVAGVDTATLATLQDGDPFRLATRDLPGDEPGLQQSGPLVRAGVRDISFRRTGK